MAQSIEPSLDHRVRSLAAALTLGAGVALSAMAAAVSSATAQELEWATSIRGGAAFSTAIARVPRGNSYVTGGFFGATTFGAGEINETVLKPVGFEGDQVQEDVFVAKYARDGTLLWATSAGGGMSDLGNDIATDSRGNSYVTGSFRGTATFGAGEANETVLRTSRLLGLFVAKYARDGTLIRATTAGGDSSTGGSGIATEPPGNSYVTGGFLGTAIFGEGQTNQTVLHSADQDADLFVVKYGR
jgi:hypothetical protein